MTQKVDKIYLVGFMGAGKSSVAQCLEAKTKWSALDIDALTVERMGSPIAPFFKKYGEAHFRQMERGALLSILDVRHVVVATGGGAFIGVENSHLMLCDGLVVWLDVPLPVISRRLEHERDIRPLARDEVAMAAFYEKRRSFYEKAHVRIDATKSPEDVANRIQRVWLNCL